MWKDVKYLIAYLSPAAAFVGLYHGGWLSFGSVYVGFILIPLLEFFLPPNAHNRPAEQEGRALKNRFFDALLYLNLPVVYGLVGFFVWRIAQGNLTALEYVGMTLNIGVILGTCAINVAHELGHRNTWFDAWVARLLLVSSLYSHFTIEHNYGHHKHVGTPEDPATARLGESVYAFWLRSVTGSFVNALSLQSQVLKSNNTGFWNLHNGVLIGLVLQLMYLVAVTAVGGLPALLCIVIASVIGILLLESVNYIEHYGLVREKLPSGRFEPVEPKHSWNSNHELGRIFLYELTRHADHHYRTTRKYQILRHLESAPQLPYGYPASIMLALVPPAWMDIMDKRI